MPNRYSLRRCWHFRPHALFSPNCNHETVRESSSRWPAALPIGVAEQRITGSDLLPTVCIVQDELLMNLVQRSLALRGQRAYQCVVHLHDGIRERQRLIGCYRASNNRLE